MQAAQTPAKAVQITGSRDAIDWALQQGLLPNAHFHAAHGLAWIEVTDISKYAEFEMLRGGLRVHHARQASRP